MESQDYQETIFEKENMNDNMNMNVSENENMRPENLEVKNTYTSEDSENIYDEVAIPIRKTNNYSIFKNILGNRDLRGTNYNKLIKSMQEKQLIIPILCNDKLEIIDGQHRYEACKELKYPLYYYVVDGYEIDDVKRANLVSCNWVVDDYLKLNIEIGKKEYIEFKRIKDEYNVSTSQLLDIFARYQERSLKETRMLFEDGSFELENLDDVLRFLDNLSDFNFFREYTSFSFIKAFLKISGLKEYDHATMRKRLEKQPYKLEKRASYKDYIEMLVDIYNYGITKVRFGYDARQDRFYFM